MYARNQIMGAAAQTGQDYGAALGASYAEQETKRIPELPAQMDNLQRGINFAENCLNDLENRLGPVLRSPTPEPAGVGQQITAAPPVTSFASALHQQARDVTRIGERLQDFLRRLEV